jgi:uncharacterized membrane protein
MRKGAPTRQWPWRLLLILTGIAEVAMTLEAFREGNFWIIGYSAQLGRVGYTSTLGLAVIGVIIVFIGIIPWPKDRGKAPRKNKWRTHL